MTERRKNGKGSQFTREDPGINIVVRLRQADLDLLSTLALKQERSISAHIRFLIREALRQQAE